MLSTGPPKLDAAHDFAKQAILSQFGDELQKFRDHVPSFSCCVGTGSVDIEGHAETSYNLNQILSTDSSAYNRCVTALVSLCNEAQLLSDEARTRHFPCLALYVRESSEAQTDDTAVLDSIGRMLPCFQEVAAFIQRCSDTLCNLNQQLSMLVWQSQSRRTAVFEIGNARLDEVFLYIGRLLRLMFTVDELIQNHPLLLQHWRLYLRSMRLLHTHPDRFGAAVNELRSVEVMLEKLNAQLMTGYVLQNCCEQVLDTEEIPVTSNRRLSEILVSAAMRLHSGIARQLNQPGETIERETLLELCLLCVFHIFAFRAVDKKMFRTLFDSYKKITVIHLYGDQYVSPCDVLLCKFATASKLVDAKTIDAANASRSLALQQLTLTLGHDCDSCSVQVSAWLCRLRACEESLASHSRGDEMDKQLDARSRVILQGIKYAYTLRHLASSLLGLHVTANRPMTKRNLACMFRLVEMVKSIHTAFSVHWRVLSDNIPFMCSQLSDAALKVLSRARLNYEPNILKFNPGRSEIICSFTVAQVILSTSPSRVKLLVLRVCMGICSQDGALSQDDVKTLDKIVKKLELLCSVRYHIAAATNCDFVYWQRSLLGAHLSQLARDETLVSTLPSALAAVTDVLPMMKRMAAIDPKFIEATKSEVTHLMAEKLLNPLFQSLENDLRISTHAHLPINERHNPLTGASLAPVHALLRFPPLPLFDGFVDIARHCERYLNQTFYNMTAVALHDWKTYAQMRQLARSKYGLHLESDTLLPSQQLEQGVDVLHVMRNIEEFAARFAYNVNAQAFVERRSQAKFVRTVSSQHITNSIRAHGFGIMNTSVNFTYQFLKKKFIPFSQFLYNDQIKARLLTDARHFTDNLDSLKKMYPYERAEKFERGVRRLGVSADNLSGLDKFRLVIAEIGNAMGYIRLLRAGALRCIGQSASHVASLNDIDFTHASLLAERPVEQTSETTHLAVDLLDASLQQLKDAFGDKWNYLRLLVDVFSREMRSEKHSHFKPFYVIVPPLTIAYVAHMIAAKEHITKKAPSDILFTDDGFAMGVAYILRLLDQEHDFDSLRWFDSVKSHFHALQVELKKQCSAARKKKDDKLEQALTLSVRRLEQSLREFSLLQFALSSARIFFQTDVSSTSSEPTKQTEKKEKTSEE